MYGLTEAFRSASLDPALVDAHPDSVGRAIPLPSLRIVRPDGGEAAPGEEGELVHSGPLVAKGYWNDPERTAERFRDGAVWSGDTMVGRGRTAALSRARRRDDQGQRQPHQPDRNRGGSAGQRGGARSGRVRRARRAHRAGDRAGRGRQGDEAGRFRAYLRRQLPAHMVPARIVWRDAMPVGPNGKLDRAALEGGAVKPLGPIPPASPPMRRASC